MPDSTTRADASRHNTIACPQAINLNYNMPTTGLQQNHLIDLVIMSRSPDRSRTDMHNILSIAALPFAYRALCNFKQVASF